MAVANASRSSRAPAVVTGAPRSPLRSRSEGVRTTSPNGPVTMAEPAPSLDASTASSRIAARIAAASMFSPNRSAALDHTTSASRRIIRIERASRPFQSSQRALTSTTTTAPARRPARAALQSAAPCETTGDMPESKSTCDVQPSGIATGRSASWTATTWRAPPRTNMIPLLGCASSTPPASTPAPAMRSFSPRPSASSESTVARPTRSP